MVVFLTQQDSGTYRKEEKRDCLCVGSENHYANKNCFVRAHVENP